MAAAVGGDHQTVPDRPPPRWRADPAAPSTTRFRHAITKLAHLHLVSHEEHAAAWSGARRGPGDRSASSARPASTTPSATGPARPRPALERGSASRSARRSSLVTVQPGTLDPDPAAVARRRARRRWTRSQATYVVTLAERRSGSEPIRDALLAAVAGRSRPGRGPGPRRAGYWGLLRIADAMLGNSSSALIEAPAVDLPAVDVGDRQLGRRREANVIHAPAARDDVVGRSAHARWTRRSGRAVAAAHPSLADGHAGDRIARIIAAWQPPALPRKAPIPVMTPQPTDPRRRRRARAGRRRGRPARRDAGASSASPTPAGVADLATCWGRAPR